MLLPKREGGQNKVARRSTVRGCAELHRGRQRNDHSQVQLFSQASLQLKQDRQRNTLDKIVKLSEIIWSSSAALTWVTLRKKQVKRPRGPTGTSRKFQTWAQYYRMPKSFSAVASSGMHKKFAAANNSSPDPRETGTGEGAEQEHGLQL